jgi:hypothetical protein
MSHSISKDFVFKVPTEGRFEQTFTNANGKTIRRYVLKNLKQVEEMGVFDAPEIAPKKGTNEDPK